MLDKLVGKVLNFKAVTKTKVQFELSEHNCVIELQVSDAWVINRNDEVTVVGERDSKTGKFIAYAYNNHTKGVFGKYDAQVAGGWLFVVIGLFFFWAIFPLFFHVPAGIKQISLGKKVNEAFDLVTQSNVL
ncbi:hypothetical protein [Shewanella sp. 10N.286.48.B5]|uniref:hypothetical protein n=1 Tax=Shewanella sp. 10N.286.48.B5 TaxID=1880834 RepID=UPI000C867B37|nr:hypothetical protein [Shewanella sp. 10N.286.48.B5]PMH88593.1 hypothetical protein BCU57_03705 [Shewanella sp. 10N.286.48.B5]